MIICMANILSSEELGLIVDRLKNAEFVDGKLTAGWYAQQVKNNAQLKNDAAPTQELINLVNQALKRNSLFQIAARPKAIRPIMFSRYQGGMYYGTHIDNAIMGDEELMRSDLSLTLFLSDPATYTGGELVIESTQGEQAFKLDAGSMVVYPTTTLHRVEPVTEGERLAAVTWVQSLVRDAHNREILFDLDTVRDTLFQKSGKTAEFDLLSKSIANLLRKWADV
ncbi:MAG: Fe2+-dependent dioxygenase [Microcoleus sp. PH2017_40_RAT_O_B]|uniref:Fe2+-dependent dioxygenase n=2 Tax=unclassified Microcoleus TaxID=2642155 RepID=UPI001D8B77A7|nr:MULTISPECIES: Fe2+-dependent dioxygenase [unclassified Microcoleus]MCC3454331.1 Fe2+-dependent dioxygenase [Microcoleus sp. PH2017_08_TRC_O_A]MCC3483698.1 Fe2+-dependent dioxygenase [Microcoleus sp. PH2017_14_LAR_D_A]MCC3495811.1 Fe2+-dependent dioxygenase [Microcoleus sp. PH2017_15_JOR_U_A]MCC3596724.1 Fe2+-dependent dioxygenase [Microcoleus sp. PH2017_26_ELK_O_A]MCC3611433.1 Fe2+-dependent dioxygenase [Microcoleus sp. PH2017_40_RAT_O_B]MCC3621704.1 Fe2+-dependent dioxygenase [Microcoleus